MEDRQTTIKTCHFSRVEKSLKFERRENGLLEPLFARVLLKREIKNKIGSILIPDSAQDKHASLKCEVVALGPNADACLNIGDNVIIGKYAGTWIDEDGKINPDGEFYIAQDEDCLCRVV